MAGFEAVLSASQQPLRRKIRNIGVSYAAPIGWPFTSIPTQMKKNIAIALFFLLLTLPMMSQAQEVKPLKNTDAEAYHIKSRHFRTAGWVTLGLGVAAMYGGAIVAIHDLSSGTGTAETPAYLILSGAFCAGASIPLFVAAKINGNKARDLSVHFQFDRTAPIPGSAMAPVYYPAVAVRWTIR
jgi:hypothetical protein